MTCAFLVRGYALTWRDNKIRNNVEISSWALFARVWRELSEAWLTHEANGDGTARKQHRLKHRLNRWSFFLRVFCPPFSQQNVESSPKCIERHPDNPINYQYKSHQHAIGTEGAIWAGIEWASDWRTRQRNHHDKKPGLTEALPESLIFLSGGCFVILFDNKKLHCQLNSLCATFVSDTPKKKILPTWIVPSYLIPFKNNKLDIS